MQTIRITRDLVRRAAKNSKCYLGKDLVPDSETYKKYCRSCIVSDAVFNLLPPLVKQAMTVETNGAGEVSLIRLYDDHAFFLSSIRATQVIDHFDCGLQSKDSNVDKIYKNLVDNNLTTIKVDNFPTNGFMPDVVECYKVFIDSIVSTELHSCCGSKYDIKYNPNDNKWVLPPIGKLYCMDSLPNAKRIRSCVYRCLAVNPVPAKLQAKVDPGKMGELIPKFWAEYDPNKTAHEYSTHVGCTQEGTMYCDAIKLLERVQ